MPAQAWEDDDGRGRPVAGGKPGRVGGGTIWARVVGTKKAAATPPAATEEE